jgi:hypothetical protein
MVEAGNRKLSDISFEDITELLDEQHDLRRAVIRYLGERHAQDFSVFVQIHVRPTSGETKEGRY